MDKMTSSDKITITFVKNTAKEGSRYKKRTRTNLKIEKQEAKNNEEKASQLESESNTNSNCDTHASSEVNNEICIARTRPRRGPKPIMRYEPQETVIDDDTDESTSDSDDE